MQFRKLAAVAGSALMFGATLAGAATVTKVSEITSKLGTPEEGFPIFVVGADAAASDVAGAIDIAVRLAANSKTTEPVTVEGGGTQVTVTGGKMLETDTKKLYLGSNINDALSSLDYQTMGDEILAPGKVKVGSDEVSYEQNLEIGSASVKFDQLESDQDPVEVIELPVSTQPNTEDPSTYVVKAIVSFDDTVDFTDAESEEITLFGKTYTISPDTTYEKLVLLSSAQEVTIEMGEEKTVTVGDKTYTIKVEGKVEGEDAAMVRVNGELKQAKENEYIEDYDDLFVKDVSFYTTGGDTLYGSVTILAGADKITLQNGQKVMIGDEYIDGTNVTVKGSGGKPYFNQTEAIEIAFAAPDDDSKYVKAGETWTDPVFGTIKVAFNGIDGTEKETIKVEPVSDEKYKVIFTDKSGNNVEIVAIADRNGADLAYDTKDSTGIVVMEGAYLYEGNYTVLSAEEGKEVIVKIKDIDEDDDKLTLENVVTGEEITVKYDDSSGEGSKLIRLGTYYFKVDESNDKVQITYGSSASAGSVGNEVVIYPTITTKYGAKVAFIEKLDNLDTYNINLYSTKLVLPGGIVNATEANGACGDNNGWDITDAAGITYHIVNATGCVLKSIQVKGVDYPGIVVIEEEGKKPSSYEEDQGYILVTVKKGTDQLELTNVSAYTYTGEAEFKGTSDDNVREVLTIYGTKVVKDTEDQGKVTIYYPDTQLTAAVAVGSNPEFSVGAAGTVEKDVVVPVTSDVAYLDTQVTEEMKKNYDLIVVGGPCVNRLAAELLGKTFPACGAESGIPENAAIVKVFPNAFAEGKTAVLVAGWSAENTKKACTMIQSGALDSYDMEAVKISDSTVEELTVEEAAAEETTEETTEGEGAAE